MLTKEDVSPHVFGQCKPLMNSGTARVDGESQAEGSGSTPGPMHPRGSSFGVSLHSLCLHETLARGNDASPSLLQAVKFMEEAQMLKKNPKQTNTHS